MPRYNIHIDRELPGPEQIARHKDFKKLYGNYQTATRFRFWRELRTNPRYFATLVMLVAVGALVWQTFQADAAALQPHVKAPFTQNIPYNTVNIPVAEGADIEAGRLKLSVPPLAWADSSGTAIADGEIRIDYRVLEDPADFFIAGVPMNMPPSPELEAQYIEAKPVIELRAFRGEERVHILEGVNVLLSFDARSTDSSLTTYWLDEDQRGWISYKTPERELLFDQQALLPSLPPRPKLRAPIPLGSKGGAPPEFMEADNSDYPARLSAWEAIRDEAFAEAQDTAPLRISFTAEKLGYFALGQQLASSGEQQFVKLMDEDDHRLGPVLDDAISTVWVYEASVSTIRPCGYNGEGRHIFDRLGEGPVSLWMRLPDGSMGVAEAGAADDEISVTAGAVMKARLVK